MKRSHDLALSITRWQEKLDKVNFVIVLASHPRKYIPVTVSMSRVWASSSDAG